MVVTLFLTVLAKSISVRRLRRSLYYYYYYNYYYCSFNGLALCFCKLLL